MTDRAPVRWSEPRQVASGFVGGRKFATATEDGLVTITFWADSDLMVVQLGPGYTLSDCLEGEALLRKAAAK